MLCVCVVCVWWVCSRFLGLSPGPPSAGPPFPWTAQNFALFFLSRRKFHSVILCQAAGVSQNETNRNPHLGWAMALNSGHNSTRRPPRERKNEISGGREKARNFGPPTLPAPTLRGPTLRFFWVRAPTTSGPHQNKQLAKCNLAKFGQMRFAAS